MATADSPTLRPLDALERTIRERADALRTGTTIEKSWTTKLLAGELAMISGKVTEEAGEFIQAAAEVEADNTPASRAHFIAEAGDLLYHALVLLRREGVDLAEVETELARRFGVSGIDEKASRKGTTDAHG